MNATPKPVPSKKALAKTEQIKITPERAIKFAVKFAASAGAFITISALLSKPMSGTKGIAKLLAKLGIFILASKAGSVVEEHSERMYRDCKRTSKEVYECMKAILADNDDDKKKGNVSDGGNE